MSIMSMFQNAFGSQGSQPAAAPAAAPQQPAQPGNLPAAGTVPAANNNPNTPAGTDAAALAPLEGMDQFNDLWKPAESPAGGAPTGMFNVDPTKLMEAAGRMDFSKAVTPDQLQAISAGGPEAVTAFAAAMNKVAQTVYAQNAMATTKIVEQAMAQGKQSMLSELPQHIKRQTVSDTLRTENPAFSHPAAAPILGALEQQMSVKYPNATASELAQMSRQYLENFSNMMKKPDTSSNQSSANSGEMDWTKFLN